MSDIAVAVIVELHKDEIHILHRIEWDGGVRARALRGGGDVIFLAGVGVHGGAKGGEKGAVEGCAVVFVIDVESIDDRTAERTHVGSLAGTATKEIPEFGGEVGSLRVAGEGGGSLGASETEKYFFAETLACFNIVFHGRAAEETGSSSGLHLRRRPTACGAEIEAWISTRTEKGREER